TLMTYASTTGTGTILSPGAGLITRRTFGLSVGPTATTLSVTGPAAASLTWLGDNGSNTWDHSALNWNNNGPSDKLFDLDSVTVDNNGSTNPPVNVVGALVPAAVTFANDGSYTLAGSGSLTTDSFVKNNGGTVTIANTGVNSLGSVSLNSGTVIVTA